MANYNHHLINNRNRKSEHRLQEKRNPVLSLEHVAQNNIIMHGPVKAYFHPLEDHITRERSFESALIISDRWMIVNHRTMMLVMIVDFQMIPNCQKLMILCMCVVSLPGKADYWKDDNIWPYHPIMHEMGISQYCFAFLWRHYHISNVDLIDVEN